MKDEGVPRDAAAPGILRGDRERPFRRRSSLWREWLQARPNFRKALNNASYLFADRVARIVVGVFVGVWMARYLGPEGFGLYSFALAFVYLLNPLTTLGLDSIVVRELVREPASGPETLGTAWLLRLLGSTAALILCNVAIGLLRPEDALLRSLVAVVSVGPLFQTVDTIDLWFQSRLQAGRSVAAKGTAFAIAAASKIVLILAEAPVIAFAVIGVVELGLSAAAVGVAYAASGHEITTWRVNWARGRNLLRLSWPLAVSSMAIVTYMKIDQVMLGEMLGARAVGIYAAATRVSELWYFIPMGIASSAFPLLVEVRARDVALYDRRMQELFDGMAALAYAIAIPLALLAPWVIDVLYGPQFGDAGAVLAIHTWASVFVFLGVGQMPWDAAEGLTRLAMVRTLMGAVTKIGLNLVLIERFGLRGAAVATLLSYACSAWLGNLSHRKTRGIFLQQSRALFVVRRLREIPGNLRGAG
jgi:PST family polysaccharide transporter